MKAYLEILNKILISPYSVHKKTRTGVDTLSLSGVQFEHDMRAGFPLLTTKKMGIKSISAELEFFIKGLSDKKWLQERGCTIWNEWANPKKVEQKINFLMHEIYAMGLEPDTDSIKLMAQMEVSDLGRIYGVQWRDWKTEKYHSDDIETTIDSLIEVGNGMTDKMLHDEANRLIDIRDSHKNFDQLKDVIERAKKNPLDRRLLVTAWRPDELDEMALPPCHYAWQILSDGKYLDLIWIQRSIDTFLGLPYNIASYGILLTLLALELNLKPRRLVGQLADTHIYENHMQQVKLQLSRTPYMLPKVEILNFKSIFDWQYTDIALKDYKCHEKIEAPIAI